MREEMRIGKIDTSREQEFLRKHGLIGESEQAAGREEEPEERTERIEDTNKC